MNNYIDKYGRVHNKPVTDSDPYPCNNAWIYSALFEKAGGSLDALAMSYAFIECSVPALKRNPGESRIPISRDEILGMSALGFLYPHHLNKWSFSPFPIPRFSAIKLLKQLWQLRPSLVSDGVGGYVLVYKHRNYFWQNNLDQIYRFAFSVPLTDRHFILKNWSKPSHVFYAALAKLDSLGKKKNGISYLKYGKGREEMLLEFPKDHPIQQLLTEKK